MSKFNLEDYELVKDRIPKFLERYDKPRIITEMESDPRDLDTVVFKAYLYSGDHLLATGWAFEERGQGYVNKTSHLENAECVPFDTQILTRDGFKFYNQLKPKEECLTYNVEKDQLEWQELQRKRKFKSEPLVELKTSRFKAKCTPNHKWVVYNGTGTKLMKHENIEYEKGNNKIILSAKEKQESKGDIENAKRLGWIFSDGQTNHTNNGLISSAYVRQSKKKNFKELEELFGLDYSTTEHKDENWKPNREWHLKASQVREVCNIFHVNTYKDLPKAVCNMTLDEVEAYYNSMIKADGYSGGFAKTYYETVESVQIAATRLGLKTGTIRSRKQEQSTKPIYILPIHKSTGAYTSEIKVRNIPPQDVWCPTLENGTWIAKQNDQVWITGNTSSIGRALANLGIHGDKRASRAEMRKVAKGQKQEQEDNQEVEEPKITRPQLESLKKRIEELGANKQAILDFFKLDKLEELTQTQLKKAQDDLDKKEKKQKQQEENEDISMTIDELRDEIKDIMERNGWEGSDENDNDFWTYLEKHVGKTRSQFRKKHWKKAYQEARRLAKTGEGNQKFLPF